ncbi:hypothetical protein ABW19_dt0207415 [Dactylella cylindrospora]|nr:hypothetical protein ABW19_dt0207415 [Dactylella cylindrospora]
MDSVREELLANFTAITDSSVNKAEQYLSITDWNLEHAIQLYLDSDGADLNPAATSSNAPPTTSAPPQTQTTSTTTSAHRPNQGRTHSDAITIDDEDEELEEAMRRAAGVTSGGNGRPVNVYEDYEDDEAMAKRLQEEMYREASRDTDRGGSSFDGVRAPMARTVETLVSPEDEYFRRMMERNRPTPRGGQSRGPAGIFNQRAPEDPMAFGDSDETQSSRRRRQLAQATNGASEVSSRASRLAEMYTPPFDLITRSDFSSARDIGKERSKWIMVNIQDSSVFDSQILNRDIWKDPAIKSTVKENFIFLQFARDSPEGEDYLRLYLNGGFGIDLPHIGIIDPRTGELLKSWTRVPDKNEFLIQLMEFLERYSLDPTVKMPVQKKPKPQKVDFDRMTEEEQMQYVLQQSMGGTAADSDDASDPDLLTKSEIKDKKMEDAPPKKMEEEDLINLDEEPAAPSTSTAPPEPISVFASISSNNHHSEPAANAAGVTRVQFRLPDGSRVVRRFSLSDPVLRIFEYVKADLLQELAKKSGDEGVIEKEFDLKSLGQNLIDVLDSTIDEAKLKMATIMVDIEN